MKKTPLSFVLLFPLLVLAHNSQTTTYPIEKFSDTYRGEVTVVKQGDNTQYSLSIFNKDNQPVINISPYTGFSESDVNNKGEIKSNVSNPPYGEQSLLISQDVNFDGVADLAVRNGFNSCYGDPSYDIYLQQDDKLVHNPEFSRLAQDYCGMFKINNAKKTLHTMTKNGAGWYQTKDFKVEKGKPVVVKIFESETLDTPISITQYTVQNRINGKMVKTTFQSLPKHIDEEQSKTAFAFVLDGPELAGKANRIFLLKGRDERLHYLLTNVGLIKQRYDGDFIYEAAINRLTFGIGQDTYIITDNDMTIMTPEKTVIRPVNKTMRLNCLEMAVKGAKNVTVRKEPVAYDFIR